ncbi:MAG: FAD-dependent oxidoreductase [Cyanobacteria bacterium P01_F01_bin.143]
MNRRDFILGTGAAVGAVFLPWPSHAQPKTGPQLKGYLRTNWSQDPFAYGTYSYIAKGSRRRDHKNLAKPLMNRLFFAGEATNPDRNSTVHAALETGRSVAKALLEYDYENIGIIGAGIAGIVAAHNLSKAGRKVQVIEARDRIGGRIHTDYSLGVACDLGASWLHGSEGNPLTEVTNAAGMRKVVTNESWVARDRGQKLEDEDLPDWVEEISYVNNVAGTSADSINQWAYALSNDYEGDELVFPDGYTKIFEYFQGNYEVVLNEIVKTVDYDENGVQLTSGSGQSEFDAVIVTVPLGVLKAGDITFNPTLPHDKQRAIERLGMGTLDKVYLQFDEVFWDKEPHMLVTPFTDYEPGYYNDWLNLYAIFGEPLLVVFNGGPAALALSTESDEKVVQGALSTIHRAYGY